MSERDLFLVQQEVLLPVCTCDFLPCVSELKETAEATQTQHRSEKQRRKQMQLRLSSLEEELQDLKTEKESLDRVRNL